MDHCINRLSFFVSQVQEGDVVLVFYLI